MHAYSFLCCSCKLPQKNKSITFIVKVELLYVRYLNQFISLWLDIFCSKGDNKRIEILFHAIYTSLIHCNFTFPHTYIWGDHLHPAGPSYPLNVSLPRTATNSAANTSSPLILTNSVNLVGVESRLLYLRVPIYVSNHVSEAVPVLSSAWKYQTTSCTI